jgi:trehalose 6-phosphate synthase/phosphatase
VTDRATGRILIVSNRLPITVSIQDGRPVVEPSVGGLATGLRTPHERSGGLWIGWPGAHDALDEEGERALDRKLRALRTVPVRMSAAEVSTFYEKISNGVLWPLFHDRLDQLPLWVEGWDVYEQMNARFADVVAAHYRPGDTVWVHDYQLLRLPALLRDRLPDARIGFFLHIPFPNPEIFFSLPCRKWLVEGMLGADVIGFHTRRYRGHFTAALRRLFGIEMSQDAISYGGRRVRLGIFPMGIDAESFAERASAPEVSAEVAQLRGTSEERFIVGIDRLDYSKGLPRRLLAMERLLARYPEWRERVRLVQVAVPSRSGVLAYKRIRDAVEGLVGRINGTFGTPAWTPIHYMYRSIPDAQLLALYRAADVMLVTPLRDGMNLVAKEFVAARTDEDGVLVLSEFAGAADELTDALIVNPYDADGTADAIHEALTMPTEARRGRMRALRAHVFSHNVERWASNFLDTMAEIPRDPAPAHTEPAPRPPSERGTRPRDAADARP